MDLRTDRKYIYDTTVFFDALRGEAAIKPRARWLIFQTGDRRFSTGFSVVSEIEMWYGIRGMWTVEQHEKVLMYLKRYPLLSRIAKRAGRYRSSLDQMGLRGSQPGIMDCVIAATAEYYGLVLVTRNSKDFQRLIDKQLAKLEIETYA